MRKRLSIKPNNHDYIVTEKLNIHMLYVRFLKQRVYVFHFLFYNILYLMFEIIIVLIIILIIVS